MISRRRLTQAMTATAAMAGASGLAGAGQASALLDGQADGVIPPTDGSGYAAHFAGPWTHHVVPGAGHNLPQEQPEAFTAAILEADTMA